MPTNNSSGYTLAKRRLVRFYGKPFRLPNRSTETEYLLRRRDIKDGRSIRAAGGWLDTAEFEAEILDCPEPENNERIEIQLTPGVWRLYYITSISPSELATSWVVTVKRRNPNSAV